MTPDTTPAPKPCPFCGDAPEVFWPVDAICMVLCRACAIESPGMEHSEADAVRRWNERPGEESERTRADALAAERDKAEWRARHTEQWYATRWERVRAYAKEHGWWDKAAAIFANGTLTMTDGTVYEPPSYDQQLNIAKHRAERAEARNAELEAGIGRLSSLVIELCGQLDPSGYTLEHMEPELRSLIGHKEGRDG